MQSEPAQTVEDLAFEKLEKLQRWAKESIPGLGKAKSKPILDPEELVPQPCDCEHTNHGIHWLPNRRTPEWEELVELTKEEDGD